MSVPRIAKTWFVRLTSNLASAWRPEDCLLLPVESMSKNMDSTTPDCHCPFYGLEPQFSSIFGKRMWSPQDIEHHPAILFAIRAIYSTATSGHISSSTKKAVKVAAFCHLVAYAPLWWRCTETRPHIRGFVLTWLPQKFVFTPLGRNHNFVCKKYVKPIGQWVCLSCELHLLPVKSVVSLW